MRETITLTENKGRISCSIPVTGDQWADILNDADLVTPELKRLLLSFYYMPHHQASYKQCAEKNGENAEAYPTAIAALGADIVKKLATFTIVNPMGLEETWPVVMGERKKTKNENLWTLRPELAKAMQKTILEDALQKYAADFPDNWKSEDYKWKALKTFQDNWDIDAPDFPDMLSRALSQHKNLLDVRQVFPRGVVVEKAREKPEVVREMFRRLYDESQPLESRIEDFIKAADKEFIYGEGKSHYQSTNVVTVYLWSRYPEKYYIYKWGEYKAVATKIGFDDVPKANGQPSEVVKGYAIYDKLQKVLQADSTLLSLYSTLLSEGADKYYTGPGLGTLTSDFGFWISRYYNPQVPHRESKTWVYAPGEGASMWEDCQDKGIMCIGWDEMDDLSAFDTKEKLDKAFDLTYPNPESTQSNSKLCLWGFSHEMAEGDVVYVKNGLYKIIGCGVVESGYYYDNSREEYRHVRRVKWTHIGVWDVKTVLGNQLPMKTLTEMPKSWGEKMMAAISKEANDNDGTVEERYWWLVASPKYWSFTDKKVGDTVFYTVVNEKGNKRLHPHNFERAAAGDIVIGYEANPVKKIVAIAKVIKPSDGETITFEIVEKLDAPVSWFDFKDIPTLQGMQFIKNRNGSFFKLTPEEYQVILDLIRQENPGPEDSNPIKQAEKVEPYSKENFLEDVFMSADAYDALTALVRNKKNVILQGAPGVGKTFSAKRLAYSMMGAIDESRIEMVQFHQNYSYEDFIMGYKPTDDGGFELRDGVFYSFCKKAEKDPDHEYFFIIDEINRGNLSKIFGELLMLIEKDYRGKAIKLAYRNELFSVPEKLHIIGMMNTADRSLAMIDYALRRRFSFYTMKPGLDTEGFRKELAKHSDERVAKVVEAVKRLNEKIADDDSLGEGFCIGHSYFCGQKPDEPWIENVVRYDLCPMLDEYWFDSKDKCQEAKNKLLELLK